MSELVIWGCGGMAREVNHLCEQRGDRVVGFLDERPEMKGRIIDDRRVLGDIADIVLLRDDVCVVCAGVGDPKLKRKFTEKTLASGFRISAPLLHPAIYLSRLSLVEEGAVLCEGVVMTVNVRLAPHVIVNRNVTIGHDVKVGRFSSISPGVNISGNVEIGECCFIGTGASISEKTQIGTGAIIGGGAFVMEDVPANCMVAGVPATVRKTDVKDWHL